MCFGLLKNVKKQSALSPHAVRDGAHSLGHACRARSHSPAVDHAPAAPGPLLRQVAAHTLEHNDLNVTGSSDFCAWCEQVAVRPGQEAAGRRARPSQPGAPQLLQPQSIMPIH